MGRDEEASRGEGMGVGPRGGGTRAPRRALGGQRNTPGSASVRGAPEDEAGTKDKQTLPLTE